MYNSIYPVGYNQYTSQIIKKEEEEVVASDQEQQNQRSGDYNSNQQETSYAGSYAGKNVIDYSSNKVNISQVLVDFNNTIDAIGAPEDIQKEVKGYLDLVDIQSNKDNPSTKIIKSNLKSASVILDGYISDTLDKPSKVVEGWVDALMLQQVDYKADAKYANMSVEETLNPTGAAANASNTTSEEKIAVETSTTAKSELEEVTYDSSNDSFYIPQDTNLKRALIKAQKYKEIDDSDKAIESYAQALSYAKRIEDKKAQAVIFMDVAEIKDDSNNLGDALKCFNNAKDITAELNNTELRAKAHAGMGAIYDEVGEYDAAMDHYFAVLSLDGENENLSSQAMTLNNIGSMEASKYEHKDAIIYYKEALGLAKQVPDVDAMGTILGNTAGVFKALGKGQTAIKYYGRSIKCDSKVGKNLDCAKSFEQAGDIMVEFGKNNKALNLYKNAFISAKRAQNKELADRIRTKLL